MKGDPMSNVVAGLFGAMLALLIYTRLGGLATVLLAFGILIAYVLIELLSEWRVLEAARRDSALGMARLERMRSADLLRRRSSSDD